MAMSNEAREHLNSVRNRISQARDRQALARKGVQIARADNDADRLAMAQRALDEADAEVQTLKAVESNTLATLAGVGRMPGANLLHNVEAQDTLAGIAESSHPVRTAISIGQFMSQDEVVAMTGQMLAVTDVPAGGGRTGFGGIVAPPVPPTSLLAFFQSIPFDTRTIDFFRRSGVASAAIAPAGSVKQQSDLDYVAATVRAVVVAAWTKVNKVDLADVEALSDDLRQALAYGVIAEVERLLLQGAPADADGPTVPGLLDETFAPTITATNLADAIGQARAQLRAIGVQPNFAAANAETVEEEAERTGTDDHYVDTIDDQGRIRRLPLVETEALADGQVIVGDSRIAARLGVRQGLNVLVGDQDQDDLVRNRVTILTEGRWAPIVAVPTATAFFTLA